MKLFFLLALTFLFTNSYGQFFRRNVNEYNSEGQKHGIWMSYFDQMNQGEKVISSKVHYNDGYETGICKHYHTNGNIRLKWRYYKNRVRAKYYFENRQLEEKGWARIDWDERQIHYYWHGKWKFFENPRKLIRVGYYLNGDEVPKINYLLSAGN